MRISNVLLCMVAVAAFSGGAAMADWVTKDGFIDYAQHQFGVPPTEYTVDGMPDFDQRQDAWTNANGQWTWCGPVAVGNCLWWYDSKFEMIKCKSLPPGTQVRPPAISDHYALVSNLTGQNLDDHMPANVVPFITAVGNALPGGIPANGINANQMQTMIQAYLTSVGLSGHYTVTIVSNPPFMRIYQEVEVSQDVMALLGFWQTDGTHWWRFGGHWLTVAGVDTQNATQTISFSDPCGDNAEAGFAGVVWNGWLLAHNPMHGVGVHNDAGNVSHDWYPVQGSNSPGGIISPNSYGYEWSSEWSNFQGLNTPDRLQQYQGQYDPTKQVHTELEDIVVVCPNFDYGDLHYDYPTIDIVSCGPAHPLTGIGWLGASIDAEIQPRIDVPNGIYNQDNFDDGVQFVGLPWTPGTQCTVVVTLTSGALYTDGFWLNAWKDGNIDGDFDDGPNNPAYVPAEDDWLQCSEWVLRDLVFDPPAAGQSVSYTLTFCDPGVTNMGTYDLRMRFRLTSQAVGRYGYGGYWGGGVSNGRGTYDIDWVLGEVEDYIIEEGQLAVELRSFEAVPRDRSVELRWTTASEQDNALFSLARRTNGGGWSEITRVPSAGNSATDQHYSFFDTGLENGRLYEYRLTSMDIFGQMEELAVASATPTAEIVVTEYALHQNYPNPFNAVTSVTFDLVEGGPVSLKVYNLMGQEVATLAERHMTSGRHTVSFDAASLPSGIYLYMLDANGFTATRKMVLMK